jgi:hypothetical protein
LEGLVARPAFAPTLNYSSAQEPWWVIPSNRNRRSAYCFSANNGWNGAHNLARIGDGAARAWRETLSLGEACGANRALYNAGWSVREAIDAAPAANLGDLAVKARATLVALEGDVEVENVGSGSYRSLSEGIIRGVLALATPARATSSR